MPAEVSSYHRDKIAKDGFTVIKNFLTPEEIAKYKEASEKVIKLARDGKWDAVRTRGKQFPPWPKNYNPDIWGISGLLHPDLGELALPFHDLYASDKLLDVAGDILQAHKEELSMELFNMLINPLTDFELEWHRDYIKPEVSPEQEAVQLLSDPYAGTQFNLPLTEDKCLIVVPGSHNRVRTEEERRKTTDSSKKGFITNQIVVELSPGDVVFYNSNILHRAAYSSQTPRITLHGSYGHVEHGKTRAKGVLQHGIADWLPRFQTDNENLILLREKLEQLSEEFKGQDLGYALEG